MELGGAGAVLEENIWGGSRGNAPSPLKKTRCREASAEGGRIDAPKVPSGIEWGGVWGWISPPQPLEGLGERRELTQRGPRADLQPETYFGVFLRP